MYYNPTKPPGLLRETKLLKQKMTKLITDFHGRLVKVFVDDESHEEKEEEPETKKQNREILERVQRQKALELQLKDLKEINDSRTKCFENLFSEILELKGNEEFKRVKVRFYEMKSQIEERQAILEEEKRRYEEIRAQSSKEKEEAKKELLEEYNMKNQEIELEFERNKKRMEHSKRTLEMGKVELNKVRKTIKELRNDTDRLRERITRKIGIMREAKKEVKLKKQQSEVHKMQLAQMQEEQSTRRKNCEEFLCPHCGENLAEFLLLNCGHLLCNKCFLGMIHASKCLFCCKSSQEYCMINHKTDL